MQEIPSSQSEYSDPPIRVLHFKGRRNLDAIMAELSASFGLDGASHVLYSGASAGGLTTYLHCENIRGMLAAKTKVNCQGDAGFFIDHQ